MYNGPASERSLNRHRFHTFRKFFSIQRRITDKVLEIQKNVNIYLFIYLFILMILMREGDTPEGASPKGLGWPLHREKKKNLNEMKAGNPSQTQKIGQY